MKSFEFVQKLPVVVMLFGSKVKRITSLGCYFSLVLIDPEWRTPPLWAVMSKRV